MESYGREYPLQLIRDWDKSMVGQREYKEALARNLYRYVVKGEELTEIGFQREFLGRIGQIVRLQALNEAELKALFLHPTKGVLSRLQKKYEADGIRLEVEDAVVDDIIRSVVQENLGARSLPNVMEQLLSGVWIRCIEEGYDKIIINKGTLRGEDVKFSNENRYISMSS